MTTARFVHDGNTIDYTPGADVTAGDVIVQGDLVGIAKLDIKANSLGALAVDGVFDVPKAAGSAINVGTKVYWDATNKLGTTSDGGGANKLLGKAILTAASAATTVRVRLTQ